MLVPVAPVPDPEAEPEAEPEPEPELPVAVDEPDGPAAPVALAVALASREIWELLIPPAPGEPPVSPPADVVACDPEELATVDRVVPDADGDVADAEDVADAVAEDDDEEDETSEQLKSYKGVVLRVEPTMPNEGFGVVGAASWSVYHQVLTLPNNMLQPTSSQYALAFSSDGSP